jgi:hypothetical protein
MAGRRLDKMLWYDWLLVIFIWSIIGGSILVRLRDCRTAGAIYMADGWEFVNPIHVYKYNKVNWFGAIVVATIYNAFCPIGAVCYWCYKICTVGRK